MAEDKKKIEPSLDGGDAEAAGEHAAESKGFNAKKIILFVVVPLFILGGVGAGLYFTGTIDKILGSGEHVEAEGGHGEAPAEGHGEAPTVEAVFLPIPDMIVNLSAEGTKQNYLKLKVQLEVASEADKAAVEAVMPRVIDQFQTYLRELRPKDLRGSAGIYRLQMELLSRVNAAAAPTKVRDVLFQEILIQ
jgi:flagellar FliL protein